MRRLVPVTLLTAAATGGLLGLSPAAQADRDFSTTRFPLRPVGDSAVRGTVIDIHTEGVRIYAQERYQLRGATPGATYRVTLDAYADAACDRLVIAVGTTAEMTANRAGAANGRTTFTPADVEGLVRGTYYLRWTVLRDGSTDAVAVTDCVPVLLD